MNNEPVAWMSIQEGIFSPSFKYLFSETKKQGFIPLYTHPVKELDEQFKKGFKAGKEEGWKAHKFHHPVKELTDEEITEVATINLGHSMGLLNWMGFARAILRKAQEK
jgi:hypothetical protein